MIHRFVFPFLTLLMACGGKTSTTADPEGSRPDASVAATADADASNGADARATGSGGGGSNGKAALGDSCIDGADCASGVCFNMGAGRMFCTLRCSPETAATVCAGLFEGRCNTMGYCRLPGGPGGP
jgi:hypothetical protein